MSRALGAIARRLLAALAFGYGLFTIILYNLVAIRRGSFFRRSSEKEVLELQLARDRLWDLSREYCGLSHQFLTLSNGFRFHYLCNEPVPAEPLPAKKPLLIFIHGFPDSWAVWRYVVNSASLQNAATVVAVDLPGYGGTEGLDHYSATNVLENLANFIIGVRARFGIDNEETGDTGSQRTIVLAHDWGCVLSMRLAAEAPNLADRFILSNAPLISLVASNIRRLLSSSLKMFKTSIYSPIRSRSTLIKAIRSLGPVYRQLYLSGYIFAMRMPFAFVRYFATGGNYSLLKTVHKGSYGKAVFTDQDAAECMASTLGPSKEECKTKTAGGEEYPTSIKTERTIYNLHHMACYYRDGAGSGRWQKSIETVANLHTLSQGNEMRRASSGAGMFDDGPTGVLKAYSTVIWGKNDIALEPQLCLDGISDYLISHSQVIELPQSGHFTPIEGESRIALEKAAEWAVKGEREDIGAVISACYPSAVVTVRK